MATATPTSIYGTTGMGSDTNPYNPQTQSALYDSYQYQAGVLAQQAQAQAAVKARLGQESQVTAISGQQQANYTGKPYTVTLPTGQRTTFYPTNTTAQMQGLATGATSSASAAPVASIGTPVSTGGVSVGGNTQSLDEQLRYDPWAQYRGTAASQLASTMNPSNDPSNQYRDQLAQMTSGQFSPSDPSYQWRFQQGQQAVERSQAAKGLLNSGNAAIELQQYGQNAASQEYAAQFQRLTQGLAAVESQYQTQQARLMEMAGVNANPVAGGELNVQQGQLGVQQGQLGINAGQLGVNAQQVQNQYAVGMANAQNQTLAGSAQMWASIFG